MYRLYWARATGAFAPQAILEEVGAGYEKVELDREAGEHRQPAYLKINPMGQIPSLVLPDGTVMTEAAAMVLHIADCHPEAGLLPPPGDPGRARVYRWLFFASCDIYETDLRQAYSERYTADPQQAAGVRVAADTRMDWLWPMVDAALEPGPYLLGERFGVADVYLCMLAGWHFDHPKLFQTCPRVKRMLDLVRQRPGIAQLWAEHFGHKPAFA